MARSRNIKPGFFTNELLAELSAFDRLLFVGLWCLADREGRLEDRSKRIKMELFPCDSYDVEEGLESLRSSGFIDRYQVGTFSVVEIVNFTKHQSPHGSEKDSALPDCNGYLTINERRRNVVVPYKSTKVHIKESLLNVKPPLEVVEPNVSERPDSLIPDSLIPDSYKDQEHLPPVDEKPEKEERSKTLKLADLINLGVNEQHAKDWLAVRKQKKSPLTETAMAATKREADKAGLSIPEAIRIAAESGWAGFKAEWLKGDKAPAANSKHHGFEQRDYFEGLTQREDGTYGL